MQWSLDPPTTATASRLRREIGDYLRSNACEEDAVWAAETAVSELIGNAVVHTDGPVRVSLVWDEPQPVVAVHDLGDSFDFDLSCPELDACGGRGLWLVSQMASELAMTVEPSGGKQISARLAVTRAAEPTH